MVSYLGLGVFYVGLVSSLSSAASVPALLFWGNLSDRVRKRKIFILMGFYGSFATLLSMILVHTFLEYILVMMAFQVVAMASVPVSTLIIVENSPEKNWSVALSKFNSTAAAGTLVGLVSGSVAIFTAVGNEPVFLPLFYVAAGLFYLFSSLAVSFTIPEPARKLSRNSLRGINAVRIFEKIRYFPASVIHLAPSLGRKNGKLSSDLKLYLLSTTLLMFGFQVFMVAFPVYVLESLDAGQGEIFVLYLANSIGSAVAFRFAGNMSQKHGDRKLTGVALASRVIIFASMGVVALMELSGPGTIYLSIVMYGIIGALWAFIGLGQIKGVSRLAGKRLRGKGIGYYNSLNGVAQIGAGITGGFIALSAGYGADFILASLIVLFTSGLALRLTAPVEQSVQ